MEIQFLDGVYVAPDGTQAIERQVVVLLDENDVQHLQAGKLGTIEIKPEEFAHATTLVVTTEAALTRAINHLRQGGTQVVDKSGRVAEPAETPAAPEAEGPASVLVFPSQAVEA